MVELSPTEVVNTMRVGFAGDTFNTAWYLARLWGDAGTVRYATKIGLDDTSRAFASFTSEAGIATDLIETHPTRGMGLYMIHLKDGERTFTYWRDTSAARTLADDPAKLERALSLSKNIYLSGITVAILSPGGRDRLNTALVRARDSGHRIIYDTNLRPKLWTNAQQMQQETERFAGCADIVLPSFDDEAIYFGFANPEATATHYKALGALLVVVKDGSRPILVADDNSMQFVAQEPVDAPTDTTAAGDSFNAGFLADYIVNGDAITASQKASRLARRVIMGNGALVNAAFSPFSAA